MDAMPAGNEFRYKRWNSAFFANLRDWAIAVFSE
jgi:hypothetical protein